MKQVAIGNRSFKSPVLVSCWLGLTSDSPLKNGHPHPDANDPTRPVRTRWTTEACHSMSYKSLSYLHRRFAMWWCMLLFRPLSSAFHRLLSTDLPLALLSWPAAHQGTRFWSSLCNPQFCSLVRFQIYVSAIFHQLSTLHHFVPDSSLTCRFAKKGKNSSSVLGSFSNNCLRMNPRIHLNANCFQNISKPPINTIIIERDTNPQPCHRVTSVLNFHHWTHKFMESPQYSNHQRVPAQKEVSTSRPSDRSQFVSKFATMNPWPHRGAGEYRSISGAPKIK